MQLHGLRVWRPSNSRPGMRMAVWSQVKVCGRRLSLRPIGCMPAAVCDTKAQLQLQYAASGAIYRVAQKSKPLSRIIIKSY